MKKKLAWVTDSTASFSAEEKEWLQEKNVYVAGVHTGVGTIALSWINK